MTDGSTVAAVYDRRMENETGAHRAPLQEDKSVVAAVYDGRLETVSIIGKIIGKQNHGEAKRQSWAATTAPQKMILLSMILSKHSESIRQS